MELFGDNFNSGARYSQYLADRDWKTFAEELRVRRNRPSKRKEEALDPKSHDSSRVAAANCLPMKEMRRTASSNETRMMRRDCVFLDEFKK
jgi:hypothetical protein